MSDLGGSLTKSVAGCAGSAASTQRSLAAPAGIESPAATSPDGSSSGEPGSVTGEQLAHTSANTNEERRDMGRIVPTRSFPPDGEL